MNNNKLYGAILGDLAGQPYEYKYKGDFNDFNLHNPESHITDDTIMTLASADAVLHDIPFAEAYRTWYLMYPYDKYGYGDNFKAWCERHPEAYTNSYGNGCLMRLSPVIYADKNIIQSIICTHNHIDSIKAGVMLWEYYKYGNIPIMKDPEENKFHINAFDTLSIVSNTMWDGWASTQSRIETIIRKGGDTDTNASIIGELSNDVNHDLNHVDIEYVRSKLTVHQLAVLDKFNEKF